MKLIDTHAHLFDEQFSKDREEVILRAVKQGVEKMFLPNVTANSLASMYELHKRFPSHCYPMAGLHPCNVKKDFKSELKKIYKWIEAHLDECWGIGETGLDYYWDSTFIEEQKESLSIQINWAKDFNLPLILHTRDSFSDHIDMIMEAQTGSLTGIFHCFTGNLEEAKQIIDLGFFLGIGGVITFKNSGADLRNVLSKIPLEFIVLETDSPYLSPTPNRSKRNESSYLPLIAKKLAEIKGISIEEIARITTKNAESIFRG